MNHTNSIQTEYYDENDQSVSGNFYQQSAQGNSFKKQIAPEASNVASRIESNIRDYHQQIKNNKNTINQLECQRKFFQKLSIKQKDKISQIDIEKIKSTYESQIFHIKQQTSELHQIIASYHEQEQQTQNSFIETYSKIASNKEFLMQTLIQLQKQNQQIVQQIAGSSKQLKSLEQKIDENQKLIKEKQSIHRKYVQLQIQIQKLQKKLPPKKNS